MVDFLMAHGYEILLALVFIIGGAIAVFKFTALPKEEKIKQIKEWLLYAVIAAEQKFGSKTGKLKLSYCYNLFCEKMPFLAHVVTVEQFSNLVDEILEEMKDMINNNVRIAEVVSNKDNNIIAEN